MTFEEDELAAKQAEEDARKAILHLASCLEQKRWLCAIAMACAVTSLVLAVAMAMMVYGN